MNQIDLAGRSAIVTGGARGIGLAVTERFIGSGAKVAIWDVDAKAAEETAKLLHQTAVQVDVTDETSVNAALARSEAAIGPVDILVTSAGITGPNLTIAEYPADDWRRVLEVDLTGPFLCSKAVVPGMMARNYGRIVQYRLGRRQGRQSQCPAPIRRPRRA